MSYLDVFSVPHSYHLTPETNHSEITLVFVHGWLLSRRYWQPVIDNLSKDFRCLSYDLRGFGESNLGIEARSLPIHQQSDVPAFSLSAYAQDLGALLTALNLQSVWLVGHSLGGSIALWAAKLLPKQVQGVICVNTGGGVYLPKEFDRFRNVGQQIVRWRFPWFRYLPFMDCAFAKLMVFKSLDLRWGKGRLIDMLSADRAAAVGALLESTTEAEVHLLPQVVANLQQPAYFIAGAEDTVIEEKYVKHLASFHPLFDSPAGNVVVLPECGHMAMVEQPAMVSETIFTLATATQDEAMSSDSRDSILR